MFTQNFQKYACDGDSIECTVNGFDCTATLYRDDCGDPPEQRDDGFWPSLDSKDAGYIGPKSKRTLARKTKEAQEILDAWKSNDWWYVGVAVTVSRNGVELSGKYEHAIWGVECNYPKGNNAYLREVANQLLSEAIDSAKNTLAKLCQ